MSLTMTSKVSECQAETLQFMAIEKVSKKSSCTYCSTSLTLKQVFVP